VKTLPTALAAHYASGTTTLADLLKITRKDGQVFAFTSASTDVTISGQLYTSAQGLDISSLEVTAGLAVDNLELTTLDDGTIFSRVDVLAGVWRNSDFIISRYNWANPADGIEVRMVGTVGEVHLKRGSITAELRGLQQYLQQPIGSVTSKTCRARLGDALCGVSLASHTFTGAVSSITSNQSFYDASLAGDASYASVAALMHFNGANGSNTFTDSSASPKTFTRSGTPTISTVRSRFGTASAYFGVGNSSISCTNAALAAPGDFTVEYFVWRESSSGYQLNFRMGISEFASNGCGLAFINSNIYLYNGGSPAINGPVVPFGAWTHIALTRTSGLWRLFVNGASVGTYTSTSAINEGVLTIGGIPAANNSVIGNIDDFRFTPGVSRYTAAGFTVPTTVYADVVEVVPLGYFTEGIIRFTSGANTGLSQKIKLFDNGAITLSLPMLQPLNVGDSYTVIAGCQKRLSDCSSKFSNAINFQGEPHLPGVDRITAPA